MTYAAHSARGARVPCTVVEVDLDYITDVSVTPTNTDGSLCYRTPATTLQGSLPVVSRTVRWVLSTQRPIASLGGIPCLVGAKIAAEEVRPGRGLGFFGQATIDVMDFVDDDSRSEDPFYADASRVGIDLSAGTYLTKLMNRNPWWTGRRIRVIEGFATGGVWDPADAITHNYLVRDVQGPTAGRLKITAVGPLQLLNLDAKEAPLPSEGVLFADLTAVATTATISDPVIAATYPASGHLRIGDELVSFTRVADVLTIARGQLNTIADTHSAGDSLQLYLSYTGMTVVDIIEDLLTTYGGIDPSMLALAEWADEQAQWLTLYSLSGGISTPTKILTLLQELLETTACIIWWDDAIGQIRLRAVRPSVYPVDTWSDKFNLLSAPSLKVDISERVSRTDVLIDLRNAVKDPKETSSYRTRVIGIDQGSAVTEHQSVKVRLIATRWLTSAQISLAIRASYQTTAQLRDGRQTIIAEVSSKDSAREIGDVLEILTRDIVDRTGQPQRTRGIVVKREIVAQGSKYRYTLDRLAFGGRYAYFTDNPYPDFSAATTPQRDPGAFFSDALGSPLASGEPAYVFG
jgi:hypothetical protein